jgi:hypothetical protein
MTMIRTSEPFGPSRWIFALALLVAGFILLAFALLMDARLEQAPQGRTTSSQVTNGDQ